MTVDKVTMVHPVTKGRFDAPATAVKIHEASGWVVADADKAEDPRAAETGSDETPGKAARRAPGKEENK
jgi:hypothetical protein